MNKSCIKDEILNISTVTKTVGHTLRYNDKVAVEFCFNIKKNQSRHTILMASRFNSHNREENGPFPGWFVQIVGNQLSLVIGNGSTWVSVIADTPMHTLLHRIGFSVINQYKI